MHMFYPALRALNLAENATHHLHNIYPLRGAQARDANAWAKYLDEARDRFGRGADVVFAQHHWPVWGTARILEYLGGQRDLYKYLHDQTLRLMNHGFKAAEIAERLALPRSLQSTWHVRGYYGTLSHNTRSVYQPYLGWYDANPANLDPLPPVERGRKYVEYMGGPAAVLARAREDFARGEYRFVAEATSHVVFADPANVEARRLGAAALEQLGYAAESATWRNAYLLGALELRQGRPDTAARAPVSPDLVRAMSLDLFFDYLAVRLNGEKAEGHRFVLNWIFPDRDDPAGGPPLRAHPAELRPDLPGRAPERTARRDGDARAPGAGPARAARAHHRRRDRSGPGGHAGDRAPVALLFALLDDFALMFDVIEPRR
jgi:alkyl sulfatase BDS1-like metallo-beta-lactamase superfamily hydrolase